jgi:hypothetical protein
MVSLESCVTLPNGHSLNGIRVPKRGTRTSVSSRRNAPPFFRTRPDQRGGVVIVETRRRFETSATPPCAVKRIELLDSILDRGAPISANRTLAWLRRLCSWAIERGILEANPCAGIRAPAAAVHLAQGLNSALHGRPCYRA